MIRSFSVAFHPAYLLCVLGHYVHLFIMKYSWWMHGYLLRRMFHFLLCAADGQAAQSCFYCVNQLSPFAVYLVNLLSLTVNTPKSSLLSPPLCSSNVWVSVSTRCAQSVQSEPHFWNLRFPYFSDSCVFQSRVFHPCSLVPRFPVRRFQSPRCGVGRMSIYKLFLY